MTQITTYHPVNCCIYCGAQEDLRDEHIVPYSLGGLSILPAASCRNCEAITSAFEGRCASVNYGSFRLRENVQTRNPKKRPIDLTMTSRDGEIETVHLLPKEAVIATMPIFHLQQPGYLLDQSKKANCWDGAKLEVRTDSPRKPEVWKKYQAPSFTVTQNIDLDSHARLLAKIAHAIAIGNLGLNAFNHWLPPYILGHDPCLSYVVGGVNSDQSPKDVLHETRFEVWPTDDIFLVIVKIRLFSQLGGPHAQVIVGTSTQEMLNNRKPFARSQALDWECGLGSSSFTKLPHQIP